MRSVLHEYGCIVALAILGSLSVTSAGHTIPAFADVSFATSQDNLYLPMAIGQTYVYEAQDEDGLLTNRITNTSDTKTVTFDGVTVECTVVYDVEWLEVEGEGPVILEETDDWYAWDNHGNVWYFGEDTVEYLYDDDWNPIGTSDEGSWEAGVDGAEPGILMLADPHPGDSYRQEYYEDEAEDMGKVLRLNAEVSVEYGDYDGCLVTKEWSELEPGNVEHKYYAPGVGLVYVEELKGKTVTVGLVDIE